MRVAAFEDVADAAGDEEKDVAVEDAAVEDPRKVVAGKQDEKMEVGFE